MVESHSRSLLKALSWRITATIATTSIAYVIIGDVNTALAIGGVEFIVKFILYYGHERLWHRISWGKKGIGL